MAVGLLREDLLSLPGVESADLDGDSTAPTGVRVRLAPGVDAGNVGDEVQRVLALHGLRSEVEAGAASAPTVPPPPLNVPMQREPGDRTSAVALPDTDALDSVGVTEGRDSVLIEVQAGETVARVSAAGPIGPAFDQAIVAAIAELFGTRTSPLLHSVDSRDLDDVTVLTVVIEEAGQRLVGSAVVEGGRAYALGRAVWAALSSR